MTFRFCPLFKHSAYYCSRLDEVGGGREIMTRYNIIIIIIIAFESSFEKKKKTKNAQLLNHTKKKNNNNKNKKFVLLYSRRIFFFRSERYVETIVAIFIRCSLNESKIMLWPLRMLYTFIIIIIMVTFFEIAQLDTT